MRTVAVIRIWLLIVLAFPAAAAAGDQPALPDLRADLVLRGGKIVTLDGQKPQVTAVAVTADRILAIGSDQQMNLHIGRQTKVIDLGGRLAVPGFIEGHAHFLSLGRSKMVLDLRTVQDWDEIVSLVARAAQQKAAGEWIIGRGWHQEKWAQPPQPQVEGYPTHGSLSAASPRNPVLLTHASGHMCFANALAMRLAGIVDTTPDPPGGHILRDAKGSPTGAFRESAQRPINRAHAAALARRSSAERHTDLLRAVELATRECLSKGVTSFQDAGSSFATIDLLKRLADQRKLKLRLWVMVRENNQQLRKRLAEYRRIGQGDPFLSVRGIKRMVDGALGSHGAWLLEPYKDLPSSRGLNVESIDSIRETAVLAIKHECQLCVHAIGDRANREILDLFQSIFLSFPEKQDLRWRIEHAQHLHPDDIPRFAELGVIASMQGNHCTSDAPYVIERLGRRRARYGAYAWRSLLDAGATVINGTDAPVEDVDPLQSFYASVTRRSADGSVFFADQSMSRMEALQSYTSRAAFSAFEETDKGSLTPGKLADIVVLSHDILTVPPPELLQAKVLYTIVGGKVAYQSVR